jgi:hypothetical protein
MANEIAEILNTPVVKKAYDDAVSPIMKELGDWGINIVKATRLALFPIELMAAGHNKLMNLVNISRSKVKYENMIEPQLSIAGPIIEGIKYQEEDSILYDMFAELLAASIDKTRIGNVHPAFPNLIKQLSPDEALILFYLKQQSYRAESTMDYDRPKNRFFNRKLISEDLPVDKLMFPENINIYMQHLNSLDLAQDLKIDEKPIFSMTEMENAVLATGAFSVEPQKLQIGIRIWSEKSLTEFGQLFAKACIL